MVPIRAAEPKKSTKNVLGQFLANFWVLPLHTRHDDPPGEGERNRESVVPQSRKSRRVSPVQVAVNLGSRNQHTPKAGKLPKHLSANESADCFFANPQLSCTTSYVESLAFGNCCRVHRFNFHRQQNTPHRDFFGVAAAQPRSRETEAAANSNRLDLLWRHRKAVLD